MILNNKKNYFILLIYHIYFKLIKSISQNNNGVKALGD